MTYIILLTINVGWFRFIRPDWKYWVFPISIWLVLIITFILWRSHHDSNYKRLESAYWESAENKPFGDTKVRGEMDKSQTYVRKYNMTFIHAIALQTILTFTFQIIGYRRTSKKRVYKLTSVSFGILTLVTVIVELMLGIVPTGGMIG